MPYNEVSGASFETEVLRASLPVLVDFYADWCFPCQVMNPVVADVAERLAGRLKVVTLDVDHNPALSERYAVLGLPTLILFDVGRERDRFAGLMRKADLLARLAPHLAAPA